jgi:hypothetical protein
MRRNYISAQRPAIRTMAPPSGGRPPDAASPPAIRAMASASGKTGVSGLTWRIVAAPIGGGRPRVCDVAGLLAPNDLARDFQSAGRQPPDHGVARACHVHSPQRALRASGRQPHL